MTDIDPTGTDPIRLKPNVQTGLLISGWRCGRVRLRIEHQDIELFPGPALSRSEITIDFPQARELHRWLSRWLQAHDED